MIQYILECIAFQLAFLVIYDFFLKKETFFQWNRVYLIGTYVLSLVLPWVKIEALKTSVPEKYNVYPEFLWNMNSVGVTPTGQASTAFQLSWQEGVLYGGMVLAALYFGYKLLQLYKMSRNGSVERFPNFSRIVITNSEVAFSFFRSIFLGDKILEREYSSIIKHELVHIEQRHTVDLLFFELMRIVGWFNPLVYVYQNRIAELHEFIADAQVPKAERKAHYDLLLSQIFQTQHISFVNQFYKSSLIKKRIVMLQKSKSKNVFQLKYLLLVPLVFGMLAYTSLETSKGNDVLQEQTIKDAALIVSINKEIDDEVAKTGGLKKVFFKWKDMYDDHSLNEGILTKEMYFKQEIITERLYNMYADSLKKAKTPFFDNPKGRTKRFPSTAKYESYVQHKIAFQILDENLQYSLQNRFENGGTSIKLLDLHRDFSNDLLVFEVSTIKDLTGDEVRTFNNRISEIFETKTSDFKGLILTDGTYSFEVFDLDLGESEVVENQIDNNSDPIAFEKVENVAVFPGCENDTDKRGCFFENMRKHIRKHFNYPKEAQEKGIQGRVNTMFTIDETGLITNLKMRGPDSLLINEASRIIGKLPKMIAGNHKGKTVAVGFSIPITFRLDNSVSPDKQSEEISGNNGVAFSVVDEVPIFPGCEGAEEKRKCFNEMMQKHIANNFRYPQEAQDKGIQGRVNVFFVIGKTGQIKSLKMRGPDVLLENEAKRIIGLLPNMVPGKDEGKVVNVPYSIPISFKLSSEFEYGGKENGKDIYVSDSGTKIYSNGGLPIFIIDGIEDTANLMGEIDEI